MLENLVSEGKLSRAGRDFLICNLDPMHDLQLSELRGWPDLTTAASVCVCVKQSLQLTIPTGFTGNWDAVIQMNPVLDKTAVQPFGRANDLFLAATMADALGMGMVTLRSYAGIKANGPYGMGIAPDNDQVIGLPEAYCKGKSRLIGLGVEITNTTADLYRQGTATCYRFPQQDMDSKVRRFAFPGPLVTYPFPISTQQISYQPDTLASAMLLAGTRQWRAAEGAYLVAGFNDEQNLCLPAEYRQPVVYPSSQDDVCGADNLFTIACTTPSGGFTTASSWQPHRWAPINTGGIIFSGLSEQSTLTVTVNSYVEVFPTPAEPELCVLARPSAEFDPMAFSMVTRALESMPVGVPARDNGFGDWFAGLVSEFAEPIGSALNVILPGAGAVGLGAKYLANRYLAPPAASLRAPKSNPRISRPQKQAAPKLRGTKDNPYVVSVKNPPKWWKGQVAVGQTRQHNNAHYVMK